jgi:hypothetical protein
MYAATPAEEADIKLKTAQTDQIYIDKGVVTPEETGTSRFTAEGYSTETTIETEVRDLAATAADDTSTDAPEAAADAALNGAQIQAIQAIIVAVAARQIPRESGVQLVRLSVPSLDAQRAETLMGDTGKGTFTAPAPDLEAKHAALQDAMSKLQRSHTGVRGMLGRVLATNKAGKLWTGLGKVDETGEDVLEGPQSEAQEMPLPEGPPYTPERMDAKSFTSRTPDAHGGMTYRHGEASVHPAGHEVVKPGLRSTTYQPMESNGHGGEVRGAPREIKAVGDFGVQKGAHGYDVVHTPSGYIAAVTGSKHEAEALASHLHERVPHSEEPPHGISAAKASFSFEGKGAFMSPNRSGTPAHDASVKEVDKLSHAATEASKHAQEANTSAAHKEAQTAHEAAANANKAVNNRDFKVKEHEKAAKQHEVGAANATSREAHEAPVLHAVSSKDPAKLSEAAASHEAARDRHIAAAAGQKALGSARNYQAESKNEAAASTHDSVAKEYHELAAKHGGGDNENL